MQTEPGNLPPNLSIHYDEHCFQEVTGDLTFCIGSGMSETNIKRRIAVTDHIPGTPTSSKQLQGALKGLVPQILENLKLAHEIFLTVGNPKKIYYT